MANQPNIVLSEDRVIFTRHATGRALDMGLEALEIQSALFRPEAVDYSTKHESWNFVYGRICCGVHVDSEGLATVLTVLWRKREHWKADLARGAYGGRSYRG